MKSSVVLEGFPGRLDVVSCGSPPCCHCGVAPLNHHIPSTLPRPAVYQTMAVRMENVCHKKDTPQLRSKGLIAFSPRVFPRSIKKYIDHNQNINCRVAHIGSLSPLCFKNVAKRTTCSYRTEVTESPCKTEVFRFQDKIHVCFRRAQDMKSKE